MLRNWTLRQGTQYLTLYENRSFLLIDFVPHDTYLTREKTEFDATYQGCSNKQKKEPLFRKAYLQLDVLKPGDIFVSISVTFYFTVL